MLDGVACVRPATLDADGVPTNAAGNGVLLYDCPLDPAYHTGIVVRGHWDGVQVWNATATVTAAAAPDCDGCRTALAALNSSLSASGWTVRAVEHGVWVDSLGGAHPVTFEDCDFWGAGYVLAFNDQRGDVTATHCTFESRDGHGVWLNVPAAAPTASFTDCTVTHAGADGFNVDLSAGGTLAFTDCTVTAAGGDGFDLQTAAAGTGSAAFTRCTVHAADDDGFDTAGLDTAFQNCTAAAADDGFTLHGGTTSLANCAVLSAGRDGYLLRDCPTGAIAACVASNCAAAAVHTRDDCGTITIDNLLAMNSRRRVAVRDRQRRHALSPLHRRG